MKKNLYNPTARRAISGALRALDRHCHQLQRGHCGAGYLDGFQRIRRALWRLRLSLAGRGKAHNDKHVQAEALALADRSLRRELVAVKLDGHSFIPVQERGKPLRYIRSGPHYCEGAQAAYRMFREHCSSVAKSVKRET